MLTLMLLLVLWLIAMYIVIIVLRDNNILLTGPQESHHVITEEGNDFSGCFSNLSKYILLSDGTNRKMTQQEIKDRTDSKGRFKNRLSDHTMRDHYGFWGFPQILLWKFFRAYYIGLPGNGRVHMTPVRKNRRREHPDLTAESFANKHIEFSDEVTLVPAFRDKFTRPIVLDNAELQRGSDLNLAVDLRFKTINAKVAIMDYPGDSVRDAENICRQVISNFLRTTPGLTYSKSIRSDLGENSPFVMEVMRAVNKGTTVPGREKIIGIEKQLGLKLIGIFIIDLEPGAKTRELANALVAEALAKAVGKGVRATKQAEADGLLAILKAQATGDALRFESIVENLVKNQGVSTEEAAQQAGEFLRRAQTPGLTNLVEKGAVKL